MRGPRTFFSVARGRLSYTKRKMADVDYLHELRRIRGQQLVNKKQKEQEIREELRLKMEREVANKMAESHIAGDGEIDLDVEDQIDWLSAAIYGALKNGKKEFEIGFKLSKALIGRMCFEGIAIDPAGQQHRPNFYEDVVDFWVYKFENYMAYKPQH